ncbi:MAG TPA: DUF3866 family protein [Actinomycetota bacterium]|jgi:hypothetical protein|nr:DUF3866 family protein [Actinomycetota bacterium]
MPTFRTGVVSDIAESLDGLMRVSVRIGDELRNVTNLNAMTGEVAVGDRVVLNTTAVDMNLGTGGQDFVLWNLEREEHRSSSGGHIMKLRYSPCQLDVLAAESPESEHHQALELAESLDGMPVVACGLHSQIAPAAAMLKLLDPDLRIAYVMTDGGSLPLVQSNMVRLLKEKGLVDATVTCGHAFGGDYESVNIFSGLVTANEVASADIAIVAMGPGVTGTQTSLGHSAMEQGQVISAAASLGGRPVAALRISFADPRPRHRAVSRQTLSALRFGALARCTMAVPDLPVEHLTLVMDGLIDYGLTEMHDVRIVDSWETIPALEKYGLESIRSMGRTLKDDPAFFEAAGAAGLFAGQLLYQTD